MQPDPLIEPVEFELGCHVPHVPRTDRRAAPFLLRTIAAEERSPNDKPPRRGRWHPRKADPRLHSRWWRLMRDRGRVDAHVANFCQGRGIVLRAHGVVEQKFRDALWGVHFEQVLVSAL